MARETLQQRVEAFLAGEPFAVAGASGDRSKYGNRVLRAYLQAGLRVYPVNPNATEVEGLAAYPSLSALPERVHGVSVVTQPAVTARIMEEAARLGVRHVWMQPGAESEAAVKRGREAGISVIAGDACVLVVLGQRH